MHRLRDALRMNQRYTEVRLVVTTSYPKTAPSVTTSTNAGLN